MSTPQKFEFQAEIKQLLDIVIHSLYTEKEIFVRELVSNASDALEKLRHLQLTEKNIADPDAELAVEITTDDKAKTLTIADTGIGMTRAELVENLGTIAHSGSKNFLKAIQQSGEKNTNLIGQFGVGFYSAFMVAKTVRVETRSWQSAEPGQVWTSDGSGSYEIAEKTDLPRGTKITIELTDEAAEFSQEWRVREILRRYSAYVSFPVNLNGKHTNTVAALWLRNKNEITDDEYTEFYKFHAHASDAPLLRLHFAADAPLQINALLYIPQENTERLGFARLEPNVALYCRKVLIDARPKDLLPEWLRFLNGVVDSEDLPLNISRETMQDKALLGKLGKVITGRLLKHLDEESSKNPENFDKFHAQFGSFLKEGAALDYTHKDALLKLLRYESSLTENGKTTSLADYISRMPDTQKEIYYLLGQNRETIEAGPYLEAFKARNIEVLYCTEAVDEYVFNNTREYSEKKFLSADSPEVKLDKLPTDETQALDKKTTEQLVNWLKKTLGDRVAEITPSDRLTDSPALALNADPHMTPHMRRMMKAMSKDAADKEPPLKIKFEINTRHPLIKHLNTLRETDAGKAGLIAEQILDNTLITAGLFENPSQMIARLYKLLETA